MNSSHGCKCFHKAAVLKYSLISLRVPLLYTNNFSATLWYLCNVHVHCTTAIKILTKTVLVINTPYYACTANCLFYT